MLIFWGVLLVLAIVAELATQQLVSIWFGAGALGALIAAAFGANVPVQLIVFTALSLLLLICTRPILRKVLHFPIRDTNAKLDVGKFATVVQEINPLTGTGRARLNDTEWMAVSINGSIIPVGAVVRVENIDGAKLIVSPTMSTQKETVSMN